VSEFEAALRSLLTSGNDDAGKHAMKRACTGRLGQVFMDPGALALIRSAFRGATKTMRMMGTSCTLELPDFGRTLTFFHSVYTGTGGQRDSNNEVCSWSPSCPSILSTNGVHYHPDRLAGNGSVV
jgi:hypothetical protein